MKVPFAFVADEANISEEGKLNVLGMFDRLIAGAFPVVQPRMVFCFRTQSEPVDAGRTLSVLVRLVDEAGESLFEAAGDMRTPHLPPGEVLSGNQVFTLLGVKFHRAGTYRFVVHVEDELASETQLIVSAHAAPVAGLN
jgi:hypothetical protein